MLSLPGSEGKFSDSQAADIERSLPDKYNTPLPVYPRPKDPVKELNNGRLWRESPVFGIARVETVGGDIVGIGDFVAYTSQSGDDRRGRLTAIYLDNNNHRLSVSVRRLQTTEEIRAAEPGPPFPPPRLQGDQEGVWISPSVDEHIPVSALKSQLYAVSASQLGGRDLTVLGEYCPWESRPDLVWDLDEVEVKITNHFPADEVPDGHSITNLSL